MNTVDLDTRSVPPPDVPTAAAPAPVPPVEQTPDAVPAGAGAVSGRWRRWLRRRRGSAPAPSWLPIEPDDDLGALLLRLRAPLDLTEHPELDTAEVRRLRADGVQLVVPLIAAGELVGALTVGERSAELGYSADDKALLAALADQAAPAIAVGRLAEIQREEVRDRERLEAELGVARAIQQQFLPHVPPEFAGWQLAALYRPARTVGGDFYDFIPLPDGRLMVVVGDVTDKGVPAALVMASTHALLRAYGPRLVDPGEVLRTVNELLCTDIPERMFVTCLVLVLDPVTGAMSFANAGHPLPLVRRGDAAVELRATGMPLGLMTDREYAVRTSSLEPGDLLVLHSDGLAEAHDARRRMLGTARLMQLVAGSGTAPGLLEAVMQGYEEHVGDLPQEDDITLVAVERLPGPDQPWTVVDATELPTVEGGEKDGAAWVGAVAARCGLPADRVEQLRTAVAEALMNAMEHGNAGRADLTVQVQVGVAAPPDGVRELVVVVVDHGLGRPGARVTEEPDLDLKLAGRQRPRGWGLYLMRAMVDSVEEHGGVDRHEVRLRMRLPEGGA